MTATVPSGRTPHPPDSGSRPPVAPGGAVDRRIAAALVVLVVMLAAPYAVRGPKLILDDWWVLRNRRFAGVLATAGHSQAVSRPGAWLVFTIAFGLLGRHPLALYVVQTALNVAVTLALFAVLRRFLGPPLAGAVVAVRALLPNHSAMDHWASTLAIVVSLLLLLGGARSLIGACDHNRPAWISAALFAMSGLCYEASLPMAAALLLAVPFLLGHRIRWSVLVMGGLAIGSTGAWMLAHPWRSVPSGYTDLTLLYTIHFGRGITGSPSLAVVTGLVAAIAISLSLGRVLVPDLRGQVGVGEGLVGVGLLTILVGSLAFVKFPLAVVGINDRANYIGSIGSAMVWVGAGALLWRFTDRRRIVLALASAVFVLCVLPARLEHDTNYWRAGTDAEQLVAGLRRSFPHPDGPIVIGPAPLNRSGVVGLVADWDTSAALQLATGNRALVARIAPDAAAYRRAPESLRYDLRAGRRDAGGPQGGSP